jgi:hypothetical protein
MTYTQKVSLLQFAGSVTREEAISFLRMWAAMEKIDAEKPAEPPVVAPVDD